MPEQLTEAAYYTSEDERQRKVLKYREAVWDLFQQQVSITDDMRLDPPYRQNLVLIKRLMGALIVKLGDSEAVEWLQGQVKGKYPASMTEHITKGLEKLLEESCRDYQCKESEVRSYLRSVQSGGEL